MAALSLLGASIVAAVAGYVFGFGFKSGVGDGVGPRRFVADIAKERDGSLIGAIEHMITAGDTNLKLRSVKRALGAMSALLLLAGLALVLVARLA